MQIIDDIPIWGPPDEGAVSQIKTCAKSADRVALMADSTVHGAGRVMGRMEAKGKVDKKTGEVKRVGKVTQEMMNGWLRKSNVELRGAGLDESPDCYKRLPEVLAEQGKSIRILHTLTPVGVAMAGADEFDPYKD
jgi:tRNA-splicing ligase RtcB